MAKRVRQSRRGAAENVISPASPFIARKIPFFDVLTEDELDKIDAQVDWMIENVGVAFRDDPVALDIWQNAGVTPTGEHGDLIKADAKWIRSLCAQAPSQFTQISRNPDRNVVIGGQNQVFAPIYGAPFVRDLKGGRR